MRRLLMAVAAVVIGLASTAASATPGGGRFFDPTSQSWVEYGPGVASGKSPVRREMVSYNGPHAPGTIIIDTGERRLYHVRPGGKAMKYGVGVGKEGFQWAGTHRVTRKAEWPGWTPPPQMRARERAKGRILPAHMEGGPNNPLGARALYIGSTLYRIHGTNQPWTIGSAVSSGCIRLANEDVIHLYENVDVGAKVVVKR
ncbi:L,D-transpeptidase [Polymorphum gilvum]|uniref:ErfK/YbiS/YcfS/YnhG family n=1 Tax=Polymorphum gilvum (strain LMG 25793 / CGMCC 1.9160 / SL003B-26A1) TaxID=991905 RepID=F2J5X6_POLGS|nr:L,D-transpeptidase [Polymorphum gilvum]ADZ71230.1 ErfK/YbiS/YcfS/YnhG family [Polymorphum gilvum SL003B-26A1]